MLENFKHSTLLFIIFIGLVIFVSGLGIIGFNSISIGIIINNINSSKINLNRIFIQSYK